MKNLELMPINPVGFANEGCVLRYSYTDSRGEDQYLVIHPKFGELMRVGEAEAMPYIPADPRWAEYDRDCAEAERRSEAQLPRW